MDALKKYKYHIKVKSCGTCKVLAMSYNIVIVPKLEEDWTVEFEVE